MTKAPETCHIVSIEDYAFYADRFGFKKERESEATIKGGGFISANYVRKLIDTGEKLSGIISYRKHRNVWVLFVEPKYIKVAKEINETQPKQ